MSSSLYIGLMSGTSLDGIDVALVDLRDGALLLAHEHRPLPEALTAILLTLSQSNAPVSLEQVGRLETLLGEAFAEAVTDFCARHRLSPEDIRAIGSHGQTLRRDRFHGGKAVAAGGTETRVGAKATPDSVRRFLVGPKDCEITGIAITPDGRTMFCNIQHPGEESKLDAPSSHWPDSQNNPGSTKRPRSATMVITRTDGGPIGL